jgi:hypothetical protein
MIWEIHSLHPSTLDYQGDLIQNKSSRTSFESGLEEAADGLSCSPQTNYTITA